MLSIKKLSIKYDDTEILKEISLDIKKGESISIIGPSGCGKSTLLLAIGGLIHVSDGIVEKEYDDYGLILQDHGLLPWKTVEENIALGLIARDYSKNIIKEKVKEMAEELKILHLLNKYPSNLSGGERQRVAVARALVFEPDLLLFDEPTSALDSMNKDNFQNLLLKLQDKHKISYIIVTHNIEEAVILGEKIVVMNKGKIYEILDNEYIKSNKNKFDISYIKSLRKSYEFFKKCVEVREVLEKAGGYCDE